MITAAFRQGFGSHGWTIGSDFFRHRLTITVPYTNITGGADLTDFPMLVSETGLVGLGANGGDVRFTDANYNLLPREIEYCSGGTLVAWVKKTLSHTVNDVRYMFFGSNTATEPAANSAYGSQNVWTNGYAARYGLSETGTNPTVHDSTANGNNSTAQVWTPTTGKIAGGGSFNGSSNRIGLGSAIVTSGNITVSAWIYPSSTSNDNVIFAVGRNAAGSRNVIYLDAASDGNVYLMIFKSGAFRYTGSGLSYNSSSWQHIVASYNSTTGAVTMTYNGTTIFHTTLGTTGYPSGMDTTNIGSFIDNGAFSYWFVGKIDDVRVLTYIPSSYWNAFEYLNQNNPHDSYTIS